MKITMNNVETQIADGLTITELLICQEVKMPDMVSVQLNGTILDREAFPTTEVHEGDTIDLLYFMGGGGGKR